jgi:hypothetical protein
MTHEPTIALGFLVAAALAGCAAGVADPGDAEPGALDVEAASGVTPVETMLGRAPVALMLEIEACELLDDAVGERALELGCAVTTRVCPDLVRVDAGEACLVYDAVRVRRCAERLRTLELCGPVPHLPCDAMHLAATAPTGCADPLK